jgi:TRPM family ion channel
MESTAMILNGESKPVVQPNVLTELWQACRLLGLTVEQPTIVIVGGAGGMSEEDKALVERFFEEYLAPFAIQKNAAIIDGGTDAGVMRSIGRARQQVGGQFPLVGVVAREIEAIESMLEFHHTHFILCPGCNWGDESEWIAAAASALAGKQPTIAILINGGKITWEDARLNIQYGRPVLIAEGSGRAADVIATTSTGQAFDPQAIALLRTGKVHVGNFFKEPGRFIERMNDLMK